MSQIAPSEYLISLCTLAQESQESFGIAMRIGASSSTSRQPKFLQAFADFEREQSYQPGVVCLSLIAQPGLQRLYFLSEIFTKEQRLQELEPFTNLTTKMLTHLLIASMTFLH